MFHEVGNIELCALLETEPKTKCRVCLSYWDIGIVCRTCGHFLRNGTEENKKFIKYTMDLLSIPDYVIKKRRPHGHRYGKKPGDKEHYITNQLKKKCKKKWFQDIHERFIRDNPFRSRMIENGRNEDVCRQLDSLVDEDHTHHLTSQEYFYYKSNWWLRSNKTGSDTMPVQRRSDLKTSIVYLAATERKRRRRSSTKPTMGTKFFFFFMVELARFLVDGLLFPLKVTMEMNQVLIEQGDLLYKYLEQFFKA